MKKALKWVAIALVVIVGGAAAAIAMIDINSYRDQITDKLSTQLGREVTISNSLSWTPGLSPTVAIDGLNVANPDWAKGDQLLKVGALEISLQLIPLFSKQIEIDNIAIRDVLLTLEQDDKGRGNWLPPEAPEAPAGDGQAVEPPADEGPEAPPEASTAQKAPLPNLKRITFDNVQIVAIAEKGPLATLPKITIKSGELTAPRDGPFTIKTVATLDQANTTIDLTGGSLTDLVTTLETTSEDVAEDGATWPVKASFGLENLTVEIDGKLRNGGDNPGFDGDAKLTLPESGAITALGQQFIPAEAFPWLNTLKDVEVSAKASGTSFSDINASLSVAEIAITAKTDAALNVADPRSTGTVDLTVKAANLGGLTPLLKDQELPIDLAQLRKIDAKAQIKLESLLKISVENLDLTFNALGFKLAASGGVSGLPIRPRLDLAITAKGKDLADLRTLAGDALPQQATIWDMGPLDLSASIKGDPSAPAISDLTLDLGKGEQVLKLRGEITPDKSSDLKLTLRGTTLASLAALAGAEAPALGPVEVRSSITGPVPRKINLGDLKLSLAEQQLEGDLSLDLTKSRPAIKGDLRGTKLVLAKLTGPSAGAGESGGSGGSGGGSRSQYVLPDFDLPLEALNALDLDLSLAIKSLDLGDIKLKAIDTRSVIDGGKLTVKPLSLQLNGRELSGQLVLNDGLNLRLDAPNFNYGRLMRQLEVTDLMKGRADVELRLRGKGDTFRKVLGSANGRLSVVGGKGEVRTALLDRFTAGLLSALFPSDEKGVTVVNCVVSKFDIKDGVATADSLFLDTERLTATATGRLTLAPEQLDFKARQQPSTSGLRLPAGARIKGTLAKPDVSLDAVSAVTDLGGAFFGDEVGSLLQGLTGSRSSAAAESAGSDQITDCAVAMGRKMPEPPAAAPEATPGRDAGSIRQQLQDSVPRIRKDDLEDIGKDLLRGLGR